MQTCRKWVNENAFGRLASRIHTRFGRHHKYVMVWDSMKGALASTAQHSTTTASTDIENKSFSGATAGNLSFVFSTRQGNVCSRSTSERCMRCVLEYAGRSPGPWSWSIQTHHTLTGRHHRILKCYSKNIVQSHSIPFILAGTPGPTGPSIMHDSRFI